MSSLWAEVWKRPGAATPGRVVDDPGATQFSFHDGLNQIGDGTMRLPDTAGIFDSILKMDPDTPANSVSSTIRIFSDKDPTTPIFDWLPNQLLPDTSKEDPDVQVSGLGIKSLLGHGRLEAYDWDGSDDFAPNDPDWQFGVGRNLLQNPGFENIPLPNGGFEDGNADYWEATEDGPAGDIFASASLLAVDDPANADSGDFYGQLVNVSGPDAGARRTISGLIEGKTYTITGKMDEPTASGDRFRAGISDAATASHSNAYEEDGYWWAEVGNVAQPNGASDGTWQSFTLTFQATGPTAELVVVYADVGAGPDFRIDTWALSGEGVGLYPWRARIPEFMDIFEHESTIVHSGQGAVQVQSTDFVYTNPYTGAQAWARTGPIQNVSTTPGKTYTGEAWIRQDSGSNKTFILYFRRVTAGGEFGSAGSSSLAAQRVVVPTATWTKVSLTAVSDTNEITFEVRWEYQGAFDAAGHQSPVYYVDDTAFYEGLAATTAGDILTQVYDTMIDVGLRDPIVWDDGQGTDTPYLTLDFTASVDSAGAAWDTSELTTKLTMRQSYSQIMANLAREYGYEYRIVADSVEAQTYLLQVYNPGTMTTDYTAAASPAIQGGSSDTRRSVRRFLPGGTDQMVEGVGRVTARDRSTALMAALGRIEASRLDREVTDLTSAGTAAAEAIASALIDSRSMSYVLSNPQDEPLSAYVIGDELTVEDPPEVSTSARFVDVTVSWSDVGVEWETQFGSASITNPDAAVANAVSGLLARFEYPDTEAEATAPQAGGGGGGAFTIQIAASDGPEIEKEKADFVASGINDHNLVQQAIDDNRSSSVFNGLEIILGSGTFSFDWDASALPGGNLVSTNATVSIRGKGDHTTLIEIAGSAGNGQIAFDLGGSGSSIRDLRIEDNDTASLANYVISVSDNYNTVDNVSGWTGLGGTFLLVNGAVATVHNLTVDFAEVGIEVSDDWVHISDCSLFGNTGIITVGSDHTIANNFVSVNSGASTNGLILIGSGSRATVVGNTIQGLTGTLTSVNAFINIGGNYATVVGNSLACGVTGPILIDVTVGNAVVVGNALFHGGTAGDDCGIALSNNAVCADNHIEGGRFGITLSGSVYAASVSGNVLTGQAEGGIVLSNASIDGLKVTGNHLTDSGAGPAISVTDSGGAAAEAVTIDNNTIFETDQDGILVTSVNNGAIRNNLIHTIGGGTANTYDCIRVTTCDSLLIQGNHLTPNAVTTTRYGINIASGNNNAVYANYLGDSSVYGTADSVDSGTATQTSPAAGAIGGQFAY